MIGKTLDPTHRLADAPGLSQAHQDGLTRFDNVLVGVDGRPGGTRCNHARGHAPSSGRPIDVGTCLPQQ
jgi:hypothetical protein